MPLDTVHDRFEGLDPVVRRMCETLLGLEHDYARAQQFINDANEVIAQKQELIQTAQSGQDQLRINARKLQDAAMVMGYDLFKIMDQTRQREAEREIGPQIPTPTQASIAAEPPVPFSVKDFVLEKVREAYPKFRYAASLQADLSAVGQKVHPKTVGMSLYRWSLKGVVRREGKDKWFFVPEDQRTLPAQQEIELADEESA